MGLTAFRLTELANYYGVDYATIHRWKQSEKILPIYVSGEKLPRYLTKELSLIIKNSNL